MKRLGISLLLICVPVAAAEYSYGKLPLSFEPNQGQTDDRVKFMARGSGYNLFLTPYNARFFLRQAGTGNDLVPTDSDVFTMSVVGANPAPNGPFPDSFFPSHTLFHHTYQQLTPIHPIPSAIL